jgi:glutaredoxin
MSKALFAFISVAILLIFPALAASQGQEQLNQTVKLFLFWREGCPHCHEEQLFLKEMKVKYPALEVMEYEVSENRALFEEFAMRYNATTQYVPATFIGERFIGGFDSKYLIGKQIDDQIQYELKRQNTNASCENPSSNLVAIPLIGEIDPNSVSLPVFTVILGGLDSINPCAFFILLFLLSLMVHARSRLRMFIIGGIFVFFSGLIYFVFMAAWLNVFLVLGQIKLITLIAGLIALSVSVLNIKEFFFFKEGPSLSIPESAKPKLFERMRNLVKSTEYPSMIIGTAVLAIAANTYELLCTAGFPLVYTRVLTLNNLSMTEYYLYLAFYNLVYVLPLFAIVLMFTYTLGSRKLSEDEGRALKLLSGNMMLLLGLLLILAPEFLNNILAAAGMLFLAIAATAAVMKFHKGPKGK